MSQTYNHGCCSDRRSYERTLKAAMEGEPTAVKEVADGVKFNGCTPDTCMELPVGNTCGGCVHAHRCTSIFGAKLDQTYCQFFPRRFQPSQSPPHLEDSP